MLTLSRMLLSKAGWLVLSFFLILAMLVLWHELPAKLRDWQAQAVNAEKVVTILLDGGPAFGQAARDTVRHADDEITKLKRASVAELDTAASDIERQQQAARGRILDDKGIVLAAATGGTDMIAASYRAKYVELPLLERAAALITLRRANLRDLGTHFDRVNSLQRASDKLNQSVVERNQWQREAAAQFRYPLCMRADGLPGCDLVRRIKKRDIELRQARDALRDQQSALKTLELRREQVADGAAIVASATKNYADQVQRWSAISSDYALNKAKSAFARYGLQAFAILLGAVLLPIVHRFFAFFILAPLAARAQPVLLRSSGPPLIASTSGISVEVPLTPDSELLLRSGLQRSATNVRGGDKLVLDWSRPFTCIAAGLINLQRLRSDRLDHVVVTGTEVEHRVVAIEVPAGGAVVVQPRALLGVAKPRGQRLVVTRPWRIRWLISWITAQFRFIVLHGPCTLIIQGCGGVRVEDAASGRMINKQLTLGFDAGLAYGAARSASFQPYLWGQASLFNDCFSGAGQYIYEQRASGAGKGSLWGRGIKGIGDAVLSALGI